MSHQFAGRAVLFDLDGVLVDSTVFGERAWRAVGAIILCESDEEPVRQASLTAQITRRSAPMYSLRPRLSPH